MTTSCYIKFEGVDGKTADAIGKVVAARARVLGETTEYATIATAIDVLVSLRSRTADAKKNRKDGAKITAIGGIYPGWDNNGGSPKRCLRQGVRGQKPRGPIWRPDGLKVRWSTKGSKDLNLGVFLVQPEHASAESYYVIASNLKAAQDYETRARRHRINTYGTLAKWALGIAMNKLSTQNVNDGVSQLANQAASPLANVRKDGSIGTGGNFSLTVTDSLNHALAALKGGSVEIDRACQAAYNKVSGYVRQYMAKLGTDFFSDGEIELPPSFELVRKR